MLQEIINGSEYLPIWAIMIRAAILYVFLIIGTRIMRQRQVGILAGHNYLVAAGIVSLAAVRMVNSKTSIAEGIIIILIYALVNAFTSYLDVKFPRLVDRIPVPVILNGKILKNNLDRVHVTLDNLLAQLRLKDAANLSEVQEVYIEPTGRVNVLKKATAAPVHKEQLNVQTAPVNLVEVLIYDGQLQPQVLRRIGQTGNWLKAEIARQYPGKQIKDVCLATYETDGTVYIALKEVQQNV